MASKKQLDYHRRGDGEPEGQGDSEEGVDSAACKEVPQEESANIHEREPSRDHGRGLPARISVGGVDMAEFCEVIRQLNRMCSKCSCGYLQGVPKCPFAKPPYTSCPSDERITYWEEETAKQVETIVMQWAKENPEQEGEMIMQTTNYKSPCDAVTAYRDTLQAIVDVFREMLITPEVMIAAINAASSIAILQTTEGRE